MSLALAIALLTGCGDDSLSSSLHNDGKGDIDFANYYPSESMHKIFSSVERDGDNLDNGHYEEVIKVTGDTITITENDDTKILEKIVFTDSNITTTLYDSEDGDEVNSIYRHVDLGDTTLSEKIKNTITRDFGKERWDITQVCKLSSKEDKFEKSDHSYTGDLLKIECIAEGVVIYDVKESLIDYISEDFNGSHEYYNKSYYYLKKGLGMVASINDNCVPNDTYPTVIDDRETECTKKQYEYEFYLP